MSSLGWFIAESLILPSAIIAVFIGFNDLDTEGIYIWDSTGQPLSYTNWMAGDPNDGDAFPGENCGGMIMLEMSGGQWADVPCDFRLPPFCQILPQLI